MSDKNNKPSWGVGIFLAIVISIFWDDIAAHVDKVMRQGAPLNVRIAKMSIVKTSPSLVMNFTVENRNPHPIKDFRIVCEHRGKSGTEVDDNKRVVYDVVPANSSKTIENFDMGLILSEQAHTTVCKIDRAKK